MILLLSNKIIINVIFNMTKKGVRVDMVKAMSLKDKLKNKEKKILALKTDLLEINF